MFCKNCGAEIADQTVICPKCGVEQQLQAAQPVIINQTISQQPAVSSKSKWVAFVLAFFIGYLGIHRFYVGKVGTGIIWILTGGVFGIGWLVDWIMILCASFKDKCGLLLTD